MAHDDTRGTYIDHRKALATCQDLVCSLPALLLYPLPKKASPLLQAIAATLSQRQSARQATQVHAVTRQTLMRACTRYRYTCNATKGGSMVSRVRRVTVMLECKWHLRLQL